MVPEEISKAHIQRILVGGVVVVSVATWFCAIGLYSDIWLLAVVAAAAYGAGYALQLKAGHWFLCADGTAMPMALVAYVTSALVMRKTAYLPPWTPDNLGNVVTAFALAWIAGHLFSAIWVFIGERMLNTIYREQLATENSAVSAYWSRKQKEERTAPQIEEV